ncbi:MAG: hypothetical protein LBS52_02380 [Dysgonamonadaceae bacterium]|jgi:hypothetical protein|nr:hypothetical protein [Dysgonamonadaceae bacterium]
MRTWLKEENAFGETIWGITSQNDTICIFNPSKNGYDALNGCKIEEDLETV